jgi:hypothetical protein
MLERGARVVGDLVAPRIGIAEGALVRGSVRTEGDAPAPRRALVVPSRKGDPIKARAMPAPAPKPAAPPASASAPTHAAPVPASSPAASSSPEASSGPPAPVVPSLGKGVKGKKKSRRS